MTAIVGDVDIDTANIDTAHPLEQAVAALGGAVDQLEAGVVKFFEALAQASRQQLQRSDDPAVLHTPLVRAAGIRLEDVYLDQDVADAPPAVAADVDPQAAFVALAEQAGSYQVAAREHPDRWLAARVAAYLDSDVRGY
jgi:hypothetical protein